MKQFPLVAILSLLVGIHVHIPIAYADHPAQSTLAAPGEQGVNSINDCTSYADERAAGTHFAHFGDACGAGNCCYYEATTPTVTNLFVNHTLLTEDELGTQVFQVTIDFSEPMYDGVTPTLSFSPSHQGTLVLNNLTSPNEWIDSDTAVIMYDVLDVDVSISDIDITVHDAQSENAIPLTGSDSFADEFSINTGGDTTPPTVSSITTTVNDVSDTLISDADTGGGKTFKVAVTFNETMDAGTTPTITLDPNPSSTLTTTDGSWNSPTNTIYTKTYSIADAGTDVEDIDIDVSGADDAAGNTMAADTTTGVDAFSIDTQNPTVSSVTPSLTDVLYAHTDFSVDVVFSESMKNTSNPTVTLASNTSLVSNEVVADYSKQSVTASAWANATTYTARFTVVQNKNNDGTEAGEDTDNVDITIGGTPTDLAGNAFVPTHTASNAFDIDTERPTCTFSAYEALLPNDDNSNPGYRANQLGNIRITFSETLQSSGAGEFTAGDLQFSATPTTYQDGGDTVNLSVAASSLNEEVTDERYTFYVDRTPDRNKYDGKITITLPAGAVKDADSGQGNAECSITVDFYIRQVQDSNGNYPGSTTQYLSSARVSGGNVTYILTSINADGDTNSPGDATLNDGTSNTSVTPVAGANSGEFDYTFTLGGTSNNTITIPGAPPVNVVVFPGIACGDNCAVRDANNCANNAQDIVYTATKEVVFYDTVSRLAVAKVTVNAGVNSTEAAKYHFGPDSPQPVTFDGDKGTNNQRGAGVLHNINNHASVTGNVEFYVYDSLHPDNTGTNSTPWSNFTYCPDSTTSTCSLDTDANAIVFDRSNTIVAQNVAGLGPVGFSVTAGNQVNDLDCNLRRMWTVGVTSKADIGSSGEEGGSGSSGGGVPDIGQISLLLVMLACGYLLYSNRNVFSH